MRMPRHALWVLIALAAPLFQTSCKRIGTPAPESEAKFDHATAEILSLSFLNTEHRETLCSLNAMIFFLGNGEEVHHGYSADSMEMPKPERRLTGEDPCKDPNRGPSEIVKCSARDLRKALAARNACSTTARKLIVKGEKDRNTFGRTFLVTITDGDGEGDSEILATWYGWDRDYEYQPGTTRRYVFEDGQLREQKKTSEGGETASWERWELDAPGSVSALASQFARFTPTSREAGEEVYFDQISYIFQAHGGRALPKKNPKDKGLPEIPEINVPSMKYSLLDQETKEVLADQAINVFMFDPHGPDNKTQKAKLAAPYWIPMHACIAATQKGSYEAFKKAMPARMKRCARRALALKKAKIAANKGEALPSWLRIISEHGEGAWSYDGTWLGENWSDDSNGWSDDSNGWSSDADGWSSDADGWSSDADGWNTDADGWSTDMDGWSSDADGWSTAADGWSSDADGWSSDADGWSSAADGWSADTDGWGSGKGLAFTYWDEDKVGRFYLPKGATESPSEKQARYSALDTPDGLKLLAKAATYGVSSSTAESLGLVKLELTAGKKHDFPSFVIMSSCYGSPKITDAFEHSLGESFGKHEIVVLSNPKPMGLKVINFSYLSAEEYLLVPAMWSWTDTTEGNPEAKINKASSDFEALQAMRKDFIKKMTKDGITDLAAQAAGRAQPALERRRFVPTMDRIMR